MTVSKNILLAAIAVLVIIFIGVIGFIILRPASELTQVAQPSPTPFAALPTPSPKSVVINQVKLNVTSPTDGLIVKTNKITVKGLTVPMAEVFINDLELKANSVGDFSGTLTLVEGENPISVIAIDENGDYSETELTVTYEI